MVFPYGIKFLGVIIKTTALGILPNATFHLHNYILKPIGFFKAIKTAQSPDPSNKNLEPLKILTKTGHNRRQPMA